MFRKSLKRTVALLLSLILILESIGNGGMNLVHASEVDAYNYLPEATMPQEIADADTFYVGTTSAELNEDESNPYLLKIGRGGDISNEASVVLKITDATASYGKDYKIRLHSGKKEEADNPDNNQSLLDIISENEVLDDVQLTEEEEQQIMEESQNNLKDQLEEAITSMESEEEDGSQDQDAQAEAQSTDTEEDSTETVILGSDAPASEEATTEKSEDAAKASQGTDISTEESTESSADATEEEDSNWAEPASEEEKEAAKEEKKADNPLKQAKETLTGIESDRQDMTSTQQTVVDSLSQVGNYMTDVIPGATLQVDFAEGEGEKYIEIITINNSESDGNRIFYVTLSEPSEGMTNSMVSESIFTITDDEPQKDAVVTFAEKNITAESDAKSIEVVLKRTGNMTENVTVKMTSEAGSAVSGQNFAPVDADVLFPFGVKERKLTISVDADSLEKDADFYLNISDGTESKVGKIDRLHVTIKAPKKSETASDKQEIVKSDTKNITYKAGGNYPSITKSEYFIDFSKASSYKKVRGCCGVEIRDCGNGDYDLKLAAGGDGGGHWVDAAVALSGDINNAKRQYIFDGVKYRYKKESKKISYNRHNIAYYRENEDTDAKVFISSDDERFGWRERTDYFENTDAAWLKFYACKRKSGKGVQLYVDWVQPILRPFVVELKAADPLSFRTGDGDKTSKDPKSVDSSLKDSVGGYAIKYGGDEMVIIAKGDYRSQLTGVKIVNTHDKKSDSVLIDSKYLKGFNLGDNEIHVKLNNDFCTKYASFIKYEGNGDRSLRGRIKLQPVFGKVSSKIRVNKNTELTGAGKPIDGDFYINGTKVTYGEDITYNIGDTLVFSSKVTSGDYVPKGVQYTYKDSEQARKQKSGNYYYENNKYSTILKEDAYTFVPLFTENNNRVVIRINESDLKNFKAEGIFDAKNMAAHGEKIGSYYNIEVVSTQQLKTLGNNAVIFAVEPKAGYIPVWQETNNDNYYMGTSFRYFAKTRRTENVIYLFAAKEGEHYAAIQGKLFYENRTLRNLNKAGQSILPAQEGYIAGAGQSAVADENGIVQTNAFRLPASIVRDGKTVQLNKIYAKVLVAASGAQEYKDILLNRSGKKSTVKDDSGKNQSAYITQLSDLTISCIDPNVTHISRISTTNNDFVKSAIELNGQWTKVYLDIEECKMDNGETEEVKSVKFLVYDKLTNEQKLTFDGIYYAEDDQWVGQYQFNPEQNAQYAEGDRLFVQITTNKPSVQLSEEEQKKYTAEQLKAFNQTEYAPVNTGYALLKMDEYAEIPKQSLDIGAFGGVSGIPMVSNFNTALNLGPVTLKVTNLYDNEGNISGTRFYVALGLGFLVSKGSDNKDKSDTGKDYNALKSVGATLLSDGFGAGLNKAKDIFNDVDTDAMGLLTDKTKKATLGKPKWGIEPSVGLYLDFAMKYDLNDQGQMTNSRFVMQGGGIVIGVTGSFQVAWYAMIPVVYIPCYFGVAGNLNLQLMMGAATTVTKTVTETKETLTIASPDNPEEEITSDEFTKTSHNISEDLRFETAFDMMATVQIYVGVGICGTIGVRGGVELNGEFLAYPTNPNFDPYGFSATVQLKLWVDLLLFTVPIPVYKFGPYQSGLIKQLSDLEKENKDTLKSLVAKDNGLELASDSKNNTKASAASIEEDMQELYQNTEITYELKDRETPSKWSGNMEASDGRKWATYNPKTIHTILEGGYDRPDSQMIDMGEYGTLLVFLQDDVSRDASDRTAVSYSVYKNGQYSAPVIIQKDNTADFQPSITDAGDNVIITWVSSDPEKDKGNASDENYQANYLKSQEVYVASISKADLSNHKAIDQDAIIKLTDDEYYDSNPIAVYDKNSGDYNVYYVKSAEDTESEGSASAIDLANPMNTSEKTYSVIAYRVYDQKNNKGWLVDDYAPLEKPDNVPDEVYRAQLQALGGQRMLTSPIKSEDINNEDPLIADLTAIAYGGKVFFSYSIDKDYSADTDEDRDIFVQMYDFETRGTYKPIRITEDDIADSMPQLIRKGSDLEGTTYLFWRHGDVLNYIDVSQLIKYGIDENGQIKNSALEAPDENDTSTGDSEDAYNGMTEEEIEKDSYSFRIETVTPYGVDENQYSTYGQYKVAVDKDENVYVIWVDHGKNGGQEIFASAMIESELKTKAAADGENYIKTWSQANQLTNFDIYCDEPALAITEDGRMLMTFNRYALEDQGETVKTTDMAFMSCLLEPTGSVEATSITLSDYTPIVGQEIQVDVQFKNTGLTAAKDGFTAKIYQKSETGIMKEIDTYHYDAGLAPTSVVNETFTYTADENTVGSTIQIRVMENNVNGVQTAESDKFVEASEYEITSHNSYQGEDGLFYSDVIIQNVGNAASAEGETLLLEFTGPYQDGFSYGLDSNTIAKETLKLESGETKEFTLPLNVPAKVFSYYGYIEVTAKTVDKDSNELGTSNMATLWMTRPADVKLLDGKDIQMKVGESKELKLSCVADKSKMNLTPSYTVEDESIVQVRDGKLYAVGAGTTTVTGTVLPYNATDTIKVTVNVPAEKLSIKQANITKISSTNKNTATVKWGKVEKADGYEITYATDKAFKKNKVTKKTKKLSMTIRNLKSTKTYYFRVRAYVKSGNSNVYGKYSTTKYIKLSPRPGASKIKVTPQKKALKVTVNKTKYANGYRYVLSTDKAGKHVVKALNTTKRTVTFKNLKSKKNYYVKVCPYKLTRKIVYSYGKGTQLKRKTK